MSTDKLQDLLAGAFGATRSRRPLASIEIDPLDAIQERRTRMSNNNDGETLAEIQRLQREIDTLVNERNELVGQIQNLEMRPAERVELRVRLDKLLAPTDEPARQSARAVEGETEPMNKPINRNRARYAPIGTTRTTPRTTPAPAPAPAKTDYLKLGRETVKAFGVNASLITDSVTALCVATTLARIALDAPEFVRHIYGAGIVVTDSGCPDEFVACALGRHLIRINVAAMRELTLEQRMFVVAHELAHLLHGHSSERVEGELQRAIRPTMKEAEANRLASAWGFRRN